MSFFKKKLDVAEEKIVVDLTMGGTLKTTIVMKEEPLELMTLDEWIEMRKKGREDERTNS